MDNEGTKVQIKGKKVQLNINSLEIIFKGELLHTLIRQRTERFAKLCLKERKLKWRDCVNTRLLRPLEFGLRRGEAFDYMYPVYRAAQWNFLLHE